MPDAIYDIPVRRIDGSEATLRDYAGKVALVVNVASKCGLTPQYAGLEKLYETYRERGFTVLGFPANDFAGQEPGTEQEIQEFCATTYDVQFPMFAKVTVKGEARHPLYAALIAARPARDVSGDGKLKQILESKGLAAATEQDIMWNFEKFLIGRDGQVLARIAPDIKPDDATLVGRIEAALEG